MSTSTGVLDAGRSEYFVEVAQVPGTVGVAELQPDGKSARIALSW